MIRFRPLLIPTLWFLPGFLLLVALGAWQIERLHWKEGLIAAVNARVHAPVVPVEDVLALPQSEAEWRHVSATGQFVPDRDAFLFAPGPHGEPGVQVVTPFMLDEQRVILINRGFVPDAERSHIPMRQAHQDHVVTGILRFSVEPGLFTPNPDTGRRLWFSKDALAMATALGISLAAPVFVEADAGPDPNVYPLGGQTIVDFPNNHLSYAVTWFGLALALTAVYLLYHRSNGRLGNG